MRTHLRATYGASPVICVTCHLTQVNVPHHNPSHGGRYLIYLPWGDGRLS